MAKRPKKQPGKKRPAAVPLKGASAPMIKDRTDTPLATVEMDLEKARDIESRIATLEAEAKRDIAQLEEKIRLRKLALEDAVAPLMKRLAPVSERIYAFAEDNRS